MASIRPRDEPSISTVAAGDGFLIDGATGVRFLDASVVPLLSGGVLAPSVVPAPTPTTLGGIESIAAVTHKWMNSISTAGVPNLTQPDALDITFTQAGTGAVQTTLAAKANGVVSVRDFGALGNLSHDDTAAMQAAHATGFLVYYPPGKYLFSTITIAQGGIIGAGPGQSVLYSSNTTADKITYTGTGDITTGQAPTFRDVGILPTLAQTGGAAIRFTPASGQIFDPVVDNVTALNFYKCVQFDAAANFKLSNSTLNANLIGVLVDNTFSPDSGDSAIVGCNISGNITGTCVQQNASGGLKISSTKFNGGLYGYNLTYNGAVASGDLLISNCSIENITTAVNLAAASQNFSNIVISGNEIECVGPAIATDSAGHLSAITVVGNIIELGAANNGISLNNVAQFTVAANVLIGASGGTGISISSTCTGGQVHGNEISSFTTPISNSSTTVSAVKMPNGTSDFTASGGASQVVKQLTSGGALTVGTLATTDIQASVPSTKTTAYSMVAADTSLIFNGAASITLTLQAASALPGQELTVKNIAAFVVISASPNVVPLLGGAASTAILAATAGKWARLRSDGTNWIIMESN